MLKFDSKQLSQIRHFIIFLNFIAVLYSTLLYMFCTQYIVNKNLSYELMENLTVIPKNPLHLFFYSIFLLFCFLVFIFIRDDLLEKTNMSIELLISIELIITLLIIRNLNLCYNGMILVVFMDIIYYIRDLKRRMPFFVVSFLIWLFTDYSLISRLIDIPSIEVYISFLPNGYRFAASFFINFLTSVNLLLFIIFLVIYLVDSLIAQKNIEDELAMVSKVNTDLNNYINLSEKIAEDRERKRIAREIHDTLGHALTGVSAGIDACIVLIDIDPAKCKAQLQVISQVVRQGIGDVRRSLQKLRPGALEQHSFKEALNQMIQEYKELSNLDIELYYEWEHIDLDQTKEDIIFRIIQESITNALRHGHATRVEINMFNYPNAYYIIIQDDGKGVKDIRPGYGLKQMQERAAMLGGHVVFHGDNGFRIFVSIPKRKGEDIDD